MPCRENILLGAVALVAVGTGVALACCGSGGPGRQAVDGKGSGGQLGGAGGADAGGSGAMTACVPDISADAGTDAGDPPSVFVDPRQPCDGKGKLCATGGVCSVRPVLPYSSVGVLPVSYGSVSACSEPFDPSGAGFSFDMLIEETSTVSQTDPRVVDRFYYGRKGADPGGCGVSLEFRATLESPSLRVGDKISVSDRVVRGTTSDTDNTVTIVIRDADGNIVLASVEGARPERIQKDLLNGLSLSIGEALCAIHDQTMVHVWVADGSGGSCGADAMTRTCCTLWGGPYEIRVQDAFTSPPNAVFPSPWVNFELARTGFWTPSPSGG